MGARNLARKPLVVAYGLGGDDPKGERLRAVLAREGVSVLEAGPERLGDQVGALAGLPGFAPARAPYTGEVPGEPFLLLCHMDDERLWKVVRALREADASVALKCSLTPTNRTWTLAALMGEVAAEHAAIQAQRAAAKG